MHSTVVRPHLAYLDLCNESRCPCSPFSNADSVCLYLVVFPMQTLPTYTWSRDDGGILGDVGKRLLRHLQMTEGRMGKLDRAPFMRRLHCGSSERTPKGRMEKLDGAPLMRRLRCGSAERTSISQRFWLTQLVKYLV